MTPLIAGLILFWGVHLVPTAPVFKAQMQGALGEGGYKGLFALLSAAGFVLIIYGFGQRSYVPLWTPPEAMRHVTGLLMLPVFILLAASQIPSHIRTWAGHPMLIAIMLWAFAHLLANGDLAGILLFGSSLLYALYDRISVGRRHALGPLGDRRGGVGGDVLAVVIGLAFYAFMIIWGHSWLIGIPLIHTVAATA